LTLRERLSLNDAIFDAGRRRFRPVLLTSITTIGGMLPILLEKSRQAQVLIPLANSLCFGLIVTTALVLILAPVGFYIVAKTQDLFATEKGSEEATEIAPHLQA
jgi:multidrug efflux pump subunit AcrB